MSKTANGMNVDPKVSCGAVTWRKTPEGDIEFLLIKQFENVNSWGIPKGKIQHGESCEECALREVFEETGIRIMLGHQLKSVISHRKIGSRVIVSYLATQVCDSKPVFNGPDSEVFDAAWHNVNKLPPIHDYQKTLISEAIELISELNHD